MKKFIKSNALVTALVSLALFQSVPSNAFVAVTTGMPLLFALGFLGGPGAIVVGAITIDQGSVDAENGNGKGIGEEALGAAEGLLGIVLLSDNSGAGTVQFQPFNTSQAQLAQMSQKEFEGYNGSLPQINLISATIFSEMAQMKSQGMSDTAIISRTQSLWTEYTNILSPEALSGLNKVRAELSHELVKG